MWALNKNRSHSAENDRVDQDLENVVSCNHEFQLKSFSWLHHLWAFDMNEVQVKTCNANHSPRASHQRQVFSARILNERGTKRGMLTCSTTDKAHLTQILVQGIPPHVCPQEVQAPKNFYCTQKSPELTRILCLHDECFTETGDVLLFLELFWQNLDNYFRKNRHSSSWVIEQLKYLRQMLIATPINGKQVAVSESLTTMSPSARVCLVSKPWQALSRRELELTTICWT